MFVLVSLTSLAVIFFSMIYLVFSIFKRNGKIKKAGKGLLAGVLLFIFAVMINPIDGSTAKDSNQNENEVIEEEDVSDVERLEKHISGFTKGDNSKIVIDNNSLVAQITFDSNSDRFEDVTMSSASAIEFLSEVRNKEEDLFNKITSWEFIFYSDDKIFYKAKADQYINYEVDITNQSNNKTEKINAEQVNAYWEEYEKREKETREKEKIESYNTGITFDNLARNPEDYINKKVKFSGRVIQVMENGDSTDLRVVIDNNHDNVVLVSYKSSIINNRVLEKDSITFLGNSEGLKTYTTIHGSNVTIPLINVDRIEIN